MSARTEGFLIMMVMFALSALFQVQLKLVATQVSVAVARHDSGFVGLVLTAVWSMISWRGFFLGVLAGILFLLWLLVLIRFDLSFALPLVSISTVITAVGGALILGESLTLTRIAGVVVTAVGVWLVLRS